MIHSLLLIAAIAGTTVILRFLPFWIFGGNRKTPRIISYLGRVLPCAIMGMLVVYCWKDVDFTVAPFGLPEAIGCVTVALLHIWKRNTLLSIGGGTLVYMLFVQFAF